jgi:acyl-coenzyme A synthetase/AMP-(fatty) acid ligase
VAKYGVTKLFTAPTALRMLRRAGDALLTDHDTTKLVLVSLVGEPLDPDTWFWTRDVLGKGALYVNNTYGQTETGTAWSSSMVGLTPTRRAGFVDSPELQRELAQCIVDAVGAIARPARVLVVSTVPRTRSGKIMRRVLRRPGSARRTERRFL